MARRSFAFSYDDLGRLTSSAPTLNTMTKATDNYGYDPTSRVTSGPVTGTTGNPNYSYSETGAITQATTHFATAAYAPNGQLCWTSPTSTSSPSCGSPPASATTFNYDLNGNRTSSTSPLSSTSLSWQSTSGRLVCVNTAGTTCSTSSPSATTTLYSYDGEGLRTASSNNGVTNAFIWDTGASQLLADSTHDYVYLQGSVTPDLQINLTTGTVDLLIQDQNANTRGVVQVVGTNSTFDGTIVNYTDFDAYGNAITQSGGSINPGGMSNGGVTTDISTPFAFGAGYWDSSNLTYLVHRYLDNETGQFISVDPLVDQTREAYVYAGDGPVMAIDPMGLVVMSMRMNPYGCIAHIEDAHWMSGDPTLLTVKVNGSIENCRVKPEWGAITIRLMKVGQIFDHIVKETLVTSNQEGSKWVRKKSRSGTWQMWNNQTLVKGQRAHTASSFYGEYVLGIVKIQGKLYSTASQGIGHSFHVRTFENFQTKS